MKSFLRGSYIVLGLTLCLVPLSPQQQPPPGISIVKVAGNVYCLYGQGGNIGIVEGNNKLLVVDSQYARNAEQVLGEIRKLSSKPVSFLVNTHYHGDHTGGNPIIGRDAVIISHERCKESFERGLKPEQSPETMGSPRQTFGQDMTIHLGGETVRLYHFGPAHTAGDTVVVFEQSKVLHTGDLFFQGIPPYIDVNDGADTRNWFRIIDDLAEKYPDFKVIPGHGKVTDMQAWLEFSDYIKFLREQVAAAIKAGKSKEQTVAGIDLSRYGDIRDQGEFLTKTNNIEWIYDEMSKK
jgi:cyclase